MSGIYIHIPFCKQKCNYCNFHFSTSTKYAKAMVNSICRELIIRKDELQKETINTIYFGGGTPTLLSTNEIEKILYTIFDFYKVTDQPEITIEGNPDDFSPVKVKQLNNLKFNRLSIGIQSFYDNDLKYMNRLHNSREAINSILSAQKYGFENINIDLIYGVPTCPHSQWKKNLSKAFELNIPHISAYALTIEEKTPLEYYIKKGKLQNINEIHQSEQFHILIAHTQKNNFIQYEISNFGKKGYFSKHNTNYWKGVKYIGVGPSAHSFSGTHRSYNIYNNLKYIKSLEQELLPSTIEKLSKTDKFNEYIMLGLRTIWGIDKKYVIENFGTQYYTKLEKNIKQYHAMNLISKDEKGFKITEKGKFLCDGIASKLFMA